jgi:hypothetical protein
MELQEKVLYNFQSLETLSSLKPILILVTSLFVKIHEEFLPLCTTLFTDQLSSVVSSKNRACIDACILGIHALSCKVA